MGEQINLPKYTCERCGHSWIPRNNKKPSLCPRCKSYKWNIPKKKKNEK